jgi:hypothetical protein
MDKDKNQKNQSPGSKGEGSVNTGLDITRLSEIRAPQDFNAEVKRVIAHTPVDRPPKRRYFRVRPGDEWCDTLGLYETSSDFGSETYIVHPTMYDHLLGEFSIYKVVLAITMQDDLYVFPIKLPDSDGRHNTWNATKMEGAEKAKTLWIRLIPNRKIGAYEFKIGANQDYEPKWPDLSFLEILNIAFKGRIISDPNHPIIQELRGLI